MMKFCTFVNKRVSLNKLQMFFIKKIRLSYEKNQYIKSIWGRMSNFLTPTCSYSNSGVGSEANDAHNSPPNIILYICAALEKA